jgi:signal transduction histidine kinase
MNLNLRNRIAFFYIAATAVLTAALFLIIYYVIYGTVYSRIDKKLNKEYEEVKNGIYAGKDTLKLINLFEWEEREHSQVEVNPTFIQVIDRNNNLIKKSDNLFNSDLEFLGGINEKVYYNSFLSGSQIRLLQAPLLSTEGFTAGFIIIGLQLDEASAVLNSLKWVLFTGYLAALFVLFIAARWIAGRSIIPIQKVTGTAEKITKENLGERIELPENRDEIYTLTATVNELLDRLEDAVLREKQFTSDASHELRTPLSVIKGTLEVLIRKKRNQEQYEEKISYCINEVNRMNSLIDQLLLLARFESGNITPVTKEIDLNESIKYLVYRTEKNINGKGITINIKAGEVNKVKADPALLDVILENLLSNSVKYSNGSNKIDIITGKDGNTTFCKIKDYGIGIDKSELKKVFDRFYRGDKARSTHKTGDGIGLAIVKKLADMLNIEIVYESEPGAGTEVTLKF